MPVSFPTGALGNATRVQRRVRQHSTEDLSNVAGTWRDFRHNAGRWPISAGQIQQQKVLGEGAPPTALVGKKSMAVMNQPMGDLDPNCYGTLAMLGNLFGAYDTTTVDVANKWTFGLDGGTTVPEFLEFMEDNDHLPRMTVMNAKVASLALASATNSNLTATFQVNGGRFQFWDAPTQTVGSGSTPPQLLGSVATYFWPDATGDKTVYIRYDGIASETVTFSCKIGTAAAYSNSQTVDRGSKVELEDESGAKIGSNSRPLYLYIPTGATVTATDEFTIEPQVSRWSPTLPTAYALSSVNARIYADGTEICSTQVAAQLGWEQTGVTLCQETEEGGRARRAGNLICTVTPTRELASSSGLDWQKAAFEASQLSIVLDARSNTLVTGSATRHYAFQLIVPAAIPEGELFTPDAAAQNDSESFVFRAGVPASSFAYDGSNYDSHVHAVLYNSLSAF